MSDDFPTLVSPAEIAKRRRINADTLASFAVDNIPVNPLWRPSQILCN